MLQAITFDVMCCHQHFADAEVLLHVMPEKGTLPIVYQCTNSQEHTVTASQTENRRARIHETLVLSDIG